MFSTLIVALDGSSLAERALPYAVQMALASGGRLVLVRAALGPPPSGQDWERQQLAAVEEAQVYLSNIANHLSERVEIVTSVPYGDAAEHILEQVHTHNADGVVMATHGRTGLKHLLHGSVAEKVLARSGVPVFLIHARPDEQTAPSFDPTTARLLVPLDGSSFAEAALPVARQMLGIAGELVLTTVATPPDHVELDENGRVRAYLDQQEEKITREAHEYLHDVLTELQAEDPDLHATIDVRLGEAAAGISMAAVDRNADVVVMSTHGRTGLGRAVLGSVAGQVLRDGHLPVVLVGPGAPRDGHREPLEPIAAKPLHVVPASS